MTRKEAVEDLKTLKDFFIEQSGGSYPMSLEYAVHELEKDTVMSWIPVSERLPEYSGWFIVTRIITEECDKLVDLRWYSTEYGWEWEEQPIAWMSLPEPYREGGSE